jgi:hypothetical protein
MTKVEKALLEMSEALVSYAESVNKSIMMLNDRITAIEAMMTQSTVTVEQ